MPVQKEITNKLRTMPVSIEAEQTVLGAIISDNEVAVRVVCNLEDDDFYSVVNKELFAQIKLLVSQNKPVDIVMLSNSLSREDKLAKIGGVSMLASMVESIPSTANCDYYISILKRNSLLRKIIRCSNEIITNAYEEEDAEKVLARAEAIIYGIAEQKTLTGLEHVSKTTIDVSNKLAEVFNTKETLSGLKIGISSLDNETNGFKGGQLIVLAARPGCGKTTFAMNMVANLIKNKETIDKVVAIFNLEMSANELVIRLISNLARVDSKSLQSGTQTPQELSKMWEASAVLNDSNLYIDDSSLISADQILSKCRRLKAQKGALDLVVVDYLQLMDTAVANKNASKQQQVSETSRAMKILAKELNVPVILLSQMSRSIEQRDDKTPKLSDLRESGAIEQDADMVMFLTDGDFEVFKQDCVPIYLLLAKHRNGQTGEFPLKWEKNIMNFEPVSNIVKLAKDENGGIITKPKNDNAEKQAPSIEPSEIPQEDLDMPFDANDAPMDYNDIIGSVSEEKSLKKVIDLPFELTAKSNLSNALDTLDDLKSVDMVVAPKFDENSNE